MKRRLGHGGLSLLILVGAGLAVIFISPLNWRLRVVGLKLTGQIEGVAWPRFLKMLHPSSGFYLRPLLETKNPFSVVRNPYDSSEDVEQGSTAYRQRCALCHGASGEGLSAPALTSARLEHGDGDWALFRTITRGIPDTPMPPASLSDEAVWQIIAYIRSLSQAAPAHSKGPASGGDDLFEQWRPVTGERLRRATDDPADWLTFSGSYSGTRHSRLRQINSTNVKDLTLAWAYQLDTDELFAEATPLVADGVMFLTGAPNDVLALDASTGALLWRHSHEITGTVSVCCGRVNRGVALREELVLLGTLDAKLVALDARTGVPRWEVQVADSERGYSITAAPLVVDSLVITGVGGSEFGIRGFVAAYDLRNGDPVWRFNTIPSPGEPGADTWGGDSWRIGGASTWMTGSYDPELDLVYWSVANPSPLFNGEVRPGDNLYSASVVALDARTGGLRWHFQFTPHDEHDWGSGHVPVLADLVIKGSVRPVLLIATKNAFLYTLDRETGEFLQAAPFAHQTWAERIDAKGRPVRAPETEPSAKGTLVHPSAAGATNWWPPAYSPDTELLHVPTLESGAVFFKGVPRFREGELFLGSAGSPIPGQSRWTGLRALDPRTGRVVWEVSGPIRENWPRVGGALSTAGGLVFWGDDSRFFGLDAKTGERLWSVNLGGHILAAPMTFTVNGRQRLAIIAGKTVFTFAVGRPASNVPRYPT
jgi:alcohol dehydrogenase (cytochrome c)